MIRVNTYRAALVVFSLVALIGGLAESSARASIIVNSVIDTAGFNPDEMSIDQSNGGIYIDGYASGDPNVSIVKVNGASLTTLYSNLPATTTPPLTYLNGFTTDASNIWWNNGNAGSGGITELSRAPKSGAGPITRNSPTDDLDSLSWGGTTLFTAYYAGTLYSVDGSGNLTFLGFNRSTSHLSIAADGDNLFVSDDGGLYERASNGSFVNLEAQPSTFRVNGSRSATGGGFVYALDRNNLNGFWAIPEAGGADTFYSSPSFTNLQGISYYNGLIYVADTGETSGPNQDGHVWSVSLVPEPSALALVGMAIVPVLWRRRAGKRTQRLA